LFRLYNSGLLNNKELIAKRRLVTVFILADGFLLEKSLRGVRQWRATRQSAACLVPYKQIASLRSQ